MTDSAPSLRVKGDFLRLATLVGSVRSSSVGAFLLGENKASDKTVTCGWGPSALPPSPATVE